ncbi:sensor histidine kinase [Thermomonas sp.]|uniref:sensor histidine kinase n=1 Tax=Thermomonas sp. TaxID=1971895 RepID=UPI0035B2470F
MKATLRLRFALLATLLGLLLSGLASLALLRVADDYENAVSTEILRGQAEDYGLRLARGQPAPLPRTRRLRGYRADDPALPRAYAALPPGVREDPADEDTHVGVFDTAAGRLVFVIDLGDIEAMERRLRWLVVAMMSLGTGLSGWLGWLFAGIALAPLRALAREVEGLPVQPRPTHLARAVSRDELGRLAAAIDGYQARLVEADAREQAFLADASHELRTPLAVIQGVAEVLLDDDTASPTQQARHARLERGVGDMRRLLEAMLAAARRKPLQCDTVEAVRLLEAAAALALAGRGDITADIAASGDLHIARHEAELLLSGLARRLLQGRDAGTLRLHLEHGHLLMQALPEVDDDRHPQPARADSGTGSALLDRLALRLGWQVRQVHAGRIVIRLDAPAAQTG